MSRADNTIFRVSWCFVSECGMLDVAGYNNCTEQNGTWYNHTCVQETDVGAERYAQIQNETAGQDIVNLLKQRSSPADEYFK